MIDAQTRARMQGIVRREDLSLLAYVRHAYPWTKWNGGDTLARLQTMLDDEHKALVAMGQYLTRKHVPLPAHGSFPSNFTTANFLALEHLIPKLVEVERKLISDLEHDTAGIADLECKAMIEKILASKRFHLAELENLAFLQPASA